MAPVQKQYYLREKKIKIADTSFFVNRNICVLQIKPAGSENPALRRAN